MGAAQEAENGDASAVQLVLMSNSNLASPGLRSLQLGQGAPPTWNVKHTSEWDRLSSEQDGWTHRSLWKETYRTVDR